MRSTRKRTTAVLMSAVLTLSAAVQAIPTTVFAAEGVTVNMASLGVPLFNKANYENTQAKESFLYTNNGLLNPGYKFTVVQENNLSSAAPANLAAGYSNKYTKENNDSWWLASYGWKYLNDWSAGGFIDLMNKGDIQYEMSAKLSYDNHTNAKNHWSRKNDCATITMYQDTQQQKQYKSSTEGSEKTLSTDYGRGKWLTPKSGTMNFQVVLYHDTCSCGSSAVKNAAVAFADTVSAKISSVTTSGSQKYFNSGYIDITITFDENIRFADGGTSGKTADQTNELVLDAYDRKTKRSVEGVTAQLISLDENKLTYRYTVPDNNTTDIVIRGIASADKQTMFSSSNENELYLYTKNGKYENIYAGNSTFDNIAAVNSPFTDLAGNSIADEWKATSFGGNSEIYIDTVAPNFSETNISGSMMTATVVSSDDEWPEDIDRSQVFAGVGDTITVSVDFDEEISIEPENVRATLNVKDESGSIVLKGQKAESYRTSVNSNIDVTRVTFETLTITEDMVPDDDGRPISITQLTLPSGAADLCGNKFASNEITVTKAAKQQEWLDTVKPQTTVTGAVAETTYYGGDGASPANGFYIPIQISDRSYDTSIISGSDAARYISGSNAVDEASFIITDAASEGGAAGKFEYSVTGSSSAPSDDSWETATAGMAVSFTQIENGNFIHIRPAQDSDIGIISPVITINGCDYAGNTDTQTVTTDILISESTLPETDTSLNLSVDISALAEGNIKVSDLGGIEEVKYKTVSLWTEDGSEPEEPQAPTVEEAEAGDGWTAAELDGGLQTEVDIPVSATLETAKNNSVYVYVYARDRFGNVAFDTYSYNYNLQLPTFTISVPQGVSDGNIAISKLNTEEAKILGWAPEKIQNQNVEESIANEDGTVSYIQSYGTLYAVVKPDTWDDAVAAIIVDDLTDANNNFSNDPTQFQPVSKEPYRYLEITDLLSQLYPADGDPVVVDAANRTGYFQGGFMADMSGYGIDFTNDQLMGGGEGFNVAMNNYEYGNGEFVAEYKDSISSRAEMMSRYYGNVDIYTAVIDSKWISQQNHNSTDPEENKYSWVRFRQLSSVERNYASMEGINGNDIKPITLQKYTVKSARDDGNKINSAYLTSFRDAAGKAISADDPRRNRDAVFDGTAATRFKTLAGLQVSFNVTNIRVADWGIEDIDFENSYINVYKDDEIVYKQQLKAGSSGQLFILPDIDYESGVYNISVSIQAKVSGRVDNSDLLSSLCVDSSEAELDGGFKTISTVLPDGTEYVIGSSDAESAVIEEAKAALYPITYGYFPETADGSTSMLKVWLQGQEDSAVYLTNNEITAVYDPESEAHVSAEGNVYIDENGPYILCSQAVLCNGEKTPVRQVTFTAAEVAPQIDVSVVPDKVSQSVSVSVNSIYSMNGEILDVWMERNSSGAWEKCEITAEGKISVGGVTEFTEPQTLRFFAIDSGCIYNSDDVSEPVTLDLSRYIDRAAPDMQTSVISGTGSDSYEIKLELSDAMQYSNADDLKLYLSPDKPDDSSEAGFAEADSGTVTIDWGTAGELEFGTSPNAAGIYSIESGNEGSDPYWSDENGHHLSIIIKGKVPQSGSVYAYAEDEAGNVSEVTDLLSGCGATYSEPEITGMKRADDGTLTLTFSSGVVVMDPQPSAADMAYTTEKTGIPIYSDGIYSITFEDIFGVSYTQNLTVALDGELNLNVSMTPSVRTNQNVEIVASSAREDDLLKITGCSLADGSDITHTISDDGQYISITAEENCTIKVSLEYGGQPYERTFTVSNIDRSAEAAVTWEYEDEVTDGVTSGSVTAIVYPLDAEDDLTGTNGALTYTFTSGNKGDTYVFEYTDQAMNTGTVTAELPVDIEPTEPLSLSYIMEIYGSINSQMIPIDEYEYNPDKPFDFSTLSYAQRYVISLGTNVDARVILLEAGTTDITQDTPSAVIDGVSLNGKTVTVTENTDFAIGIIVSDTAENYDPEASRTAVIPVSITGVQSIGDVGVIYTDLTKYSRRVYFDPRGQNLIVTNSDVLIETEHEQYKGYYYHDFESNGSYIFYYRDNYGNTGSITATVNDIIDETIQPVSIEKPVRWWPYKVIDETGDDQSELYENDINYNVTAQVRYNMNVIEASLCYADGTAIVEADKAAINVTLDLVNVTFYENLGRTKLLVIGENGTEYELELPEISIIDKTKPVIASDYVPGEPRQSVDITFTPDEDVVCSQVMTSEKITPERPLTVTVNENGTYKYSFTDNAGNSSSVTVEVTDIDTTAPVLSFKLTEDGTVYNSWSDLAEQNDVTDAERVYISSDEDGRYSFQELSGDVTANSWIELVVERNGIYPLNVWDVAGNLTFTGLAGILVPDYTAPSIILSPQRISVAQGISETELEAALAEGVSVSDDASAAENITVTWDTSRLNTSAAGEYPVIYSAADESGNVSKSERTVRVVGSDEITLSVNGSDTTYMGTVILNTRSLKFTVGNLENSNGIYEPYMIYVKKGFKTAGQMKNGSTVVNNDSITVTGSGFYTVYVMTQNRRQYMTYLYIEQ